MPAGVGVTRTVNVGAGVTGVVTTGGELLVDTSPLSDVECCTVLILISNAPSTLAIETITDIRSITVMILAMWFFCDILRPVKTYIWRIQIKSYPAINGVKA